MTTPAGRPFHPPISHVAVGAYTIGTAMLVLGFEASAMGVAPDG